VLESNRESQKLAEDAAKGYRRYLLQQREQIAKARQRATHDLKIADNTFETVEASFQLRNLMKDSSSSFEAIQKLEAPTFDQIFKNEELRREFENLPASSTGPRAEPPVIPERAASAYPGPSLDQYFFGPSAARASSASMSSVLQLREARLRL
jgi:hypothetical protein